jgi:AraC-like DNA-binding protein
MRPPSATFENVARFLLNPRNVPLGDDNIVLNARARRHFTAPFPGPVSIKSVVRGEGRWKTAEGEFLVDTSNLLILNQDQEYSLTIDNSEPVETLCVFFRPDFIHDAARSSQTTDAVLLDDPFSSKAHAFAERTHPVDTDLGRCLRSLRSRLRADPDPLWLDARLFEISGCLAAMTLDARQRAATIPATRASTRDELFRRASRARTWLDAHFDEDVDLEQAARSACLSTHHFHRVFTRVFGITPHRYLVERRMARALHLLRATKRPVIEICAIVGFTSLGSFSTLFRERFGVPPGRVRN